MKMMNFIVTVKSRILATRECSPARAGRIGSATRMNLLRIVSPSIRGLSMLETSAYTMLKLVTCVSSLMLKLVMYVPASAPTGGLT